MKYPTTNPNHRNILYMDASDAVVLANIIHARGFDKFTRGYTRKTTDKFVCLVGKVAVGRGEQEICEQERGYGKFTIRRGEEACLRMQRTRRSAPGSQRTPLETLS